MERNPTNDLLERYLSGTASPAEAALVERWYAQQQDASLNDREKGLISNALYDHIIQSPEFSQPPVHRIHFFKTTWFRYAAILLLIAATAAFLYKTYQKPEQKIVQQPVQLPTGIQPGGNKAVLILADGSSIILDSIANGNLAAQGNTSIIKLNPGVLKYSAGEPMAENGEVFYNTIRTPKGGQYQVQLPDGTMVWLNAASSITFPTFFTKERQVTISGEAYLEVAHDKSKAFTVFANGTSVEALGTRFNVNSYADEPATCATLIQGEIKVTKNKQSIVLHPGQQAVVADAITLNKTVQVNQVMAWKNGLFNFQNEKLEEVMRQLARWYDLEIVYSSSVPDITFVGGISRNMQLADMLKTLEQSEVHYRIEGRKLTISP